MKKRMRRRDVGGVKKVARNRGRFYVFWYPETLISLNFLFGIASSVARTLSNDSYSLARIPSGVSREIYSLLISETLRHLPIVRSQCLYLEQDSEP